MGIRMLHHPTAPPRTGAEGPACVSLPPVPVSAPGASTARIPETVATAVRRAVTDLSRGFARRAPAIARSRAALVRWAEPARGYLALALTLLPRPRPARTFTVFVATADTVSARADGSPPHRRRPGRPGPGPDAAP